MSGSKEEEYLKKELYDLFRMIQKIRGEIAAIKSPQDHFSDMTDQLDAIVGATAIATNDIMENVEQINDIAYALKKTASEEDQKQLDGIIDRVGNVIVACSFQDITGQRVSKVVKAVKYVEGRVDALIAMWGHNQIAQEKIEIQDETDEYKKYLHGPALEGQGLTQREADSLLQGAGPAPAIPSTTPKDTKKTAAKEAAAKAKEEKASVPVQKSTSVASASAPAKEDPQAEEEALDQSSIDALFG